MKELKLIPKPKEYQFLKKEVTLSADWKIYLASNNADDIYAAEVLSDEARVCFGWGLTVVPNEPEKNAIVIRSCAPLGIESELFDEQGYFLSIEPEKIIIEAPSAVGRFYGIQTLRQIFRNCNGMSLPCLKIKDWPSLKWRGISDDISRGQVSTVSDFKTIIRELAFYKKNLYQPYIEDMFTFDIDSMIGRERGAITKEEMTEMVIEAKKNHVVITPIFECLGHQDRLLSFPENRKYAEIQDTTKGPWSFSPVNEDTYQFVTKLINEMAEAVPSPFFHIGGDESFDVGKGTSAKRVKEIGVGRVHAEYFSRLNKYITQTLNRQMMVYADMILNHPEALSYMPKNCIIVDWQYFPENTNFPTIKQLKDAGFQNIIASPGIWSWATYYPNYAMAFTNIGNFSAVAKREKLLGCITSSWGDGGAENLRENNMLSYAYSAAAEWETDTPDPDPFLRRFAMLYLGDDSDKMTITLKNLGWFDYMKENYIGRVFHRIPCIKVQSPDWLERLQQLWEKMQETRRLLDQQRTTVRYNKEWLDVLDHVAQRNIYLAERDQTLDHIARLLNDKKSGELLPNQQKEIITDLERLQDNLAQLTGEFQQLWLRRYKYPKLDFNMQRLGNQLAILQEFIALARSGQLTAQKPPDAIWFWYPDPKPQENATPGTHYFMRVVNLDKEPVEAFLKCWADKKAVIYINGESVFEMTYYDNVNMVYNRPKTKKVKDLFKKGKNYIAVAGENTMGAAGILLELKITLADKSTLTITGDKEWKVADKVGSKWKTSEMKGSGVQPVKLLGKGLIQPWEFIDW